MNIRLRCTNLARLPTPFAPSTFRNDYFARARPVLLPRGYFENSLPCIRKWFELPNHALVAADTGDASEQDDSRGRLVRLNTSYLAQYGDASVEVEAITTTTTTATSTVAGEGTGSTKRFTRHAAPLDLFLKWSTHATSTPITQREDKQENTRLYIAQSALDSLPAPLQADVPVPDLVRHAGKGDVYGSSLWMGVSPTNTPLHRDPNPNLFVQLAGRKRVRIVKPIIGDAVFARVQRELGAGAGHAQIRGEGMMVGKEGQMLERLVWWDAGMVQEAKAEAEEVAEESQMFEAVVESGDAVFIPKGWWHAVRGEGHGINASVNWWFR